MSSYSFRTETLDNKINDIFANMNINDQFDYNSYNSYNSNNYNDYKNDSYNSNNYNSIPGEPDIEAIVGASGNMVDYILALYANEKKILTI